VCRAAAAVVVVSSALIQAVMVTQNDTVAAETVCTVNTARLNKGSSISKVPWVIKIEGEVITTFNIAYFPHWYHYI
jgi:hypothetical protein